MTSRAYFTFLLIIAGSALSCRTLKTSKYSAYNEFRYATEQPGFRFKNDSLKIEGAWNWASMSRAIPKPSFLPRTPKRILNSYCKDHGSVLFATFVHRRRTYDADKYVPVEKKDVRYTDKFNLPFYIAVLIDKPPVHIDTTTYHPKGRNNDFQFSLYASQPRPGGANFWVMDVMAVGEIKCYDFVCILDSSYVSQPDIRSSQVALFLDDIQRAFLTR